jgi:hypothetical protein
MKILIGLLVLPLLTNSLFAQAEVVLTEYILAKEIPPLPSGEKFKAV